MGSARVWNAEERAGSRPGTPLEPAPQREADASLAVRDELQELERRRPAVARRLRGALSKVDLAPAERDRILTQVLSFVDESAAIGPALGGAEAGENGDTRVLDVLERRLSKVRESLRAARELRQRLGTMRDHDPGIASIYRTVQGLAEVDALREMKREMLTEIFQANLALQARPA